MTAKTRLTPDQKRVVLDRAEKMYKEGQSIREIARAIGKSYGFVYSGLRNRNVRFRGVGGTGRTSYLP